MDVARGRSAEFIDRRTAPSDESQPHAARCRRAGHKDRADLAVAHQRIHLYGTHPVRPRHPPHGHRPLRTPVEAVNASPKTLNRVQRYTYKSAPLANRRALPHAMQQRAVGHDETRRNGQPKVSKTSKSDTLAARYLRGFSRRRGGAYSSAYCASCLQSGNPPRWPPAAAGVGVPGECFAAWRHAPGRRVLSAASTTSSSPLMCVA